MPRTKARKSPAANAAQFARSFRKGKWRGKVNPVPVKSGKKPKRINDKVQNKIDYRPKFRETDMEHCLKFYSK